MATLNPVTAKKPTPAGSQEDSDAYTYLVKTLDSYGVTGLGSVIWGYLQKGYSEDRIMIEVQESKEWKARFAANESRRQKGLPVLSPGEYIAVESSYRQIMSAAGLPVGFYDTTSDFTKWISDDVSPTEIQARVQTAQKLIETVDPAVRAHFEQYYTQGDMVAYALDRKRTADVLARQAQAAVIGAAGTGQGFQVDRTLAERLAESGVSQDQARSGFGQAARVSDSTGRLAGLSGEQYDDDDAIAEAFFADEDAGRRRRRLASQERARFTGSSGLSDRALVARRSGSL